MKSAFLSINWNDIFKGFIVAGLASVGTIILPILNSGLLPTLADLKTAGVTGLTAGLAYLLKNFLSSQDGKFLNPESKP